MKRLRLILILSVSYILLVGLSIWRLDLHAPQVLLGVLVGMLAGAPASLLLVALLRRQPAPPPPAQAAAELRRVLILDVPPRQLPTPADWPALDASPDDRLAGQTYKDITR